MYCRHQCAIGVTAPYYNKHDSVWYITITDANNKWFILQGTLGAAASVRRQHGGSGAVRHRLQKQPRRSRDYSATLLSRKEIQRVVRSLIENVVFPALRPKRSQEGEHIYR